MHMTESKNRSGSSRDSVTTDLKEKHLHSKGAKLLDAGDCNKAIELFKKAIKTQDQSYTRYHCSLAYLENDQIHEAIVELNRAIELNPDVPEYYVERSNSLRTIGDGLSAMNDDNMANQLDDNCSRIGTIKTSLQIVKNALYGPVWFDGLGKKKFKNQRFREVTRCIVEARNMRQEMLNSSSCMLPCPSFCCHFSKETILHGLYIGPWKLHAIREYLREKGLPEGQYIGKISYGGERYLKELIPPQFIIGEHGEKWIFFPQRQKNKINKEFLKDLPKGSDCQTLVWINENTRPCAFLQEGRCMIHDAGGEEGLLSCKEFLCLTGFVFVVLKWLGLVDESEIASRNIRELNKIAIESLLILASEFYGHKSVIKHGGMIDDLLKKAIEADRSDNTRVMNELMGEYDSSMDSYEKVVSERKESLRKAVALLFKR